MYGNLIRSGKFNGFSVEGFFELEEPTQPNELEDLIDELLSE